MEENYNKIIFRPVISEKSTDLKDKMNIYCFEVNKSASKFDIKKAIEKAYNVNVLKVNVINIKGKKKKKRFVEGRKKDWKKAYIKLKEGEKIEIFEGV